MASAVGLQGPVAHYCSWGILCYVVGPPFHSGALRNLLIQRLRPLCALTLYLKRLEIIFPSCASVCLNFRIQAKDPDS